MKLVPGSFSYFSDSSWKNKVFSKRVTALTVINFLYLYEARYSNCFIYYIFNMNYWEIKLGEFKIIKNTFPDKLGNPDSLKKWYNSSKACQIKCP